MADWRDLRAELCGILGNDHVYFNPPATLQMEYDAIRFNLSGKSLRRADNKVYTNINEYDGVVITRMADTAVIDSMLEHFEMCNFGRPYIAENLNHYPFTIYY